MLDPDQYETISFLFKAIQLILSEYNAQVESKMREMKKAIKDSIKTVNNESIDQVVDEILDDESFESISEGGGFDPYGYYDYDDGEDDDDFDGDVANDPIYLADLTEYIKTWVKSMSASHPQVFQQIAGSLGPGLQRTIKELAFSA